MGARPFDPKIMDLTKMRLVSNLISAKRALGARFAMNKPNLSTKNKASSFVAQTIPLGSFQALLNSKHHLSLKRIDQNKNYIFALLPTYHYFQEERNETKTERTHIIDGVIFKEKLVKSTVKSDGKETTDEVLTRSIGDKVYEVKKVIENNITKEENENTSLSAEEVIAFKDEWDKKYPKALQIVFGKLADSLKSLKNITYGRKE